MPLSPLIHRTSPHRRESGPRPPQARTVVYASFGNFACDEATWSPAINVYQLEGRLEVCADLAGIDKRSIDVMVEPGRLTVCGHRPAPDPEHRTDRPMRILTMEIDNGPFRRVVPIPETVDLKRVESEYRGGLLWIRLPLTVRG